MDELTTTSTHPTSGGHQHAEMEAAMRGHQWT